jgi:hypothetical protein
MRIGYGVHAPLFPTPTGHGETQIVVVTGAPLGLFVVVVIKQALSSQVGTRVVTVVQAGGTTKSAVQAFRFAS